MKNRQPHQSPGKSSLQIQKLLDGDEAAWREAVGTCSGLMIETARRAFAKYNYRADNADLEDAAAAAWKNLLDNDRRLLRQCAERGNFIQLLHTLARNRAVDIIRAAMPGTAHVEPDELPCAEEPGCPPGELLDQERLRGAFRGLNENEKTALRLFYLQGKKYREIEKLTGMPVNTIGPVLSRALAKLRASAAGAG